jgi:SAM-dependent methyltransferase
MFGRNMAIATDKPFSTREYWEKRLTEKWGLHGVGHISYGRPYNEWLYRVRKRVFLRHVRKLPIQPGNASVLDVGSGTGFWLKEWRSLGVRRLVGSDLTHVAVSNLRKENPGTEIIELDITDGEAVGSIKQRFDVISAFDVLFHITDERRFEAAIGHMAGLLRPGGYFLFTDSFLRRSLTSSMHQVIRTLQEYTLRVKANGLEPVLRVPMFVVMQTPVDMTTTLPALVWRLAMAPVQFVSFFGHIYGAALFPLEVLLTKCLKESPSIEMMICKKKV